MDRSMTDATIEWIKDIAYLIEARRNMPTQDFLADIEERLTRLINSILTDNEDYYSVD